MESQHFLTVGIIALVAAAMLFIEKRPPAHVALVVAFMALSWGIYWLLFQATPPTH